MNPDAIKVICFLAGSMLFTFILILRSNHKTKYVQKKIHGQAFPAQGSENDLFLTYQSFFILILMFVLFMMGIVFASLMATAFLKWVASGVGFTAFGVEFLFFLPLSVAFFYVVCKVRTGIMSQI